MATADDVLASLEVAFASVEENQKQTDSTSTGVDSTVLQLDQVRSTAEELCNQTMVMGYEDKVAIIQIAINKSNEAQSQFHAAKQTLNGVLSTIAAALTTLREAQAQIQVLKGLTAAPPPSRAGPTTTVLPSSPETSDPLPKGSAAARRDSPERRSAGVKRPEHIPPEYPWSAQHFITWSDLRHVCEGDEGYENRGGHLYGTGRPEKTEFPPEWSDIESGSEVYDFVGGILVDIAHHPQALHREPTGEWHVVNRIDDPLGYVEVVAVVHPDGHVSAGWPKEGPRVDRNPSRMKAGAGS